MCSMNKYFGLNIFMGLYGLFMFMGLYGLYMFMGLVLFQQTVVDLGTDWLSSRLSSRSKLVSNRSCGDLSLRIMSSVGGLGISGGLVIARSLGLVIARIVIVVMLILLRAGLTRGSVGNSLSNVRGTSRNLWLSDHIDCRWILDHIGHSLVGQCAGSASNDNRSTVHVDSERSTHHESQLTLKVLAKNYMEHKAG